MTNPQTHTLDLAGTTLHYDVRNGPDDTGERTLLLIGSPMDASGFATLASHFTDRPVVTYDPRGTGRSARTDGASELSPEQHADDVHRVIEALGVDEVDLFGSSGGAVNGLALVTAHPEQVRTFVAHEPPVTTMLPDAATIGAACEDIHRTYRRDGMGPAMAKFIALSTREDPLPDTYGEEPAPDPAAFGLPADDDGDRDDPLLAQNLRPCTSYRPDVDGLATIPTRLVVAVGRESGRELAGRAAVALAGRLGVELTTFPSHHAGFLGGEYGMQGDPEGFAASLRQALRGG